MSDLLGFVVLNYVNYDETIQCVESILALPENPPIMVVDNCSPNESFDLLRQRFLSKPNVTVFQSGRNGGYSAGNNVGIRELRKMGILNVVIATSDTRIESLDLVQRCLAASNSAIAVVGPYVRGDEPGSSNPMLLQLTMQYIAALHLGRLWTTLKRIVLRPALSKPSPPGDGLEAASTSAGSLQNVYMVHGCFVFLSEHYLRCYPELDEDFFMYGEEDLIAFNCARVGLRMVYDPAMKIYHGDAKSTSPGEFRQKAVATSMAVLRRKIPLRSLINVYLRAH